MLSWNEFAVRAPDLASEGRRLLRSERGAAFLASVRDGHTPRLHAIEIGFVDGRLVGFIFGAKRQDLEEDGRYALHAPLHDDHPDEFVIGGRIRAITDPAERSGVASGWAFTPDERYLLVEFLVETALVGHRASRDDWPPRYSSWSV